MPDVTIDELRARLAETGLPFGFGASRSFFKNIRDHAGRKPAHVAEHSRPDVLRDRRAWCRGQLDLDPARLVFIDETRAKPNMTRAQGCCRRGTRLPMGVPHAHWGR